MERKVNVVEDLDGNKVVVIHDILFKGKRSIEWDDVKAYLERYVGEVYEVEDSNAKIYIGKDMPNEYAGSKYTYKLKGANAKTKANATQGIPELVEIAVGERYKKNEKERHNTDAKYGWYLYDTRFALPVFDTEGELVRYNVFHAGLLIRQAIDKKLYLYDIIEIKKETSNLFQS